VSVQPDVSIVMPVRNEAPFLSEALESVCTQATDATLEILVVDGHSTDGTRDIIERWAAADDRLRLVDNPRRGIPQALNRGLSAARGRFLVRVDGHSSVPPNYVQTLVGHIEAGECEGAGGRKQAVGHGRFGKAVAAAHSSRLGIGDSKYHYLERQELVDHIPFGVYLTERARAIGGWDEQLQTNEDYDFDFRYQRAGGRLLLDPSVVFDWRVRETPRSLAHQYLAYGRGKARALLRHPSSLHLRWCVPPALVIGLAGGALFSWTMPGLLVLAVVGGSYAVFLLVGSATLGSRIGIRLIPHVALALATMHLSWGAGFLAGAGKELLRGVAGRLPGRRRGSPS
jgi:succinoglycan biosynthesis protein ExoA